MELNFIQKVLSTDLKIKPFKSTGDDLNKFLFDDAKLYQEELMTVTYLIEDPLENLTVAYYSLLSDKIIFKQEDNTVWNKLNRKIPNSKRRKSYPAIKIGRLAINERYMGLGIGTRIIDGIKYNFSKFKKIGCRFLTVDALYNATDFYIKNGFQFFTESDKNEDTRLMFFDLKNFIV